MKPTKSMVAGLIVSILWNLTVMIIGDKLELTSACILSTLIMLAWGIWTYKGWKKGKAK